MQKCGTTPNEPWMRDVLNMEVRVNHEAWMCHTVVHREGELICSCQVGSLTMRVGVSVRVGTMLIATSIYNFEERRVSSAWPPKARCNGAKVNLRSFVAWQSRVTYSVASRIRVVGLPCAIHGGQSMSSVLFF